MNLAEKEYIGRCKKLIEEKFNFESHDRGLRRRDLEYLADNIEESSGIKLSLSTLKRLWKKDYDQTPHPSTLQALVSLLGYKDWQEFKIKGTINSEKPIPTRRRKKKSFPVWIITLGVATISIAFWLIGFRSPRLTTKNTIIHGPVKFAGNKTVSRGVPNTVIFNYDLTHVEADSFFFQQSWNPLSKEKIDPNGHYYTNIYYYPGFHKARLIANDSVIKQFRVHITTDGWLPLVRNSFTDSLPVYVKSPSNNNGVLHVNPDDLRKAGVDVSKHFILSYFNVRDFENTNSDNFELDTKIKCDSITKLICPGFLLRIICEEDVFDLYFTGKGCEANAYLKIGEAYRYGSNSDLSSFGRNLYNWQHINLEVRNKHAVISVNDKVADTLTFKKDFGKIVGLVFNFSGPGIVDYVKLEYAQNKVVLMDDFDK